MNIVIPMAGLGSRFAQSGFTLPKPLINVGHKPMYRRAVDCLPLTFAKKLIFIIRENEYVDTLKDDIETNYEDLPLALVILKHETEGQAETLLYCSEYLDLNEPTLIHNCDTYIKENFNWDHLVQQNIDGAIVLFNSQEERWSYAKLDSNQQYIIDVQEKKVISDYATTGTYFFKNTSDLLEITAKNIQANVRENNEFYLSSTYKSMLQMSKKIIPLWTQKMFCFGTPQDLVNSLNSLLLESMFQ
ncbi:sugar phosphate nucleotidyltransferase [Legionella sainthelensi]|uniref:Nucleotidyl transferase domain-containing protein n=1 Tax=Legionella sainthelensi TaxID=28087 RepID=A0A2H5FRZ0_9GAMM|nr:sugar phosphate nucleotidyltransferase [Legionella sainthelensi]AUH74276.1 hypothetical protein CAB17_20285 [Legionella sainthelensi]